MSKAAGALLLVLAAGSDVFTSTEGRFHARFKVPPRYKKTTKGEGASRVVNHFFLSPVGKATYMVYFVDLAPEAAESDDGSLLALMLAGGLADAQLTLKSKREIRVGDLPGIEYRAAAPPTQALGRIVRAKDRVYIVSVIDDDGKLTDATAFIESFGVDAPK